VSDAGQKTRANLSLAEFSTEQLLRLNLVSAEKWVLSVDVAADSAAVVRDHMS